MKKIYKPDFEKEREKKRQRGRGIRWWKDDYNDEEDDDKKAWNKKEFRIRMIRIRRKRRKEERSVSKQMGNCERKLWREEKISKWKNYRRGAGWGGERGGRGVWISTTKHKHTNPFFF